MSQSTYQELGSWRDVIRITQERHPENSDPYAYAKEIIRIAGFIQLPQSEIVELALHIGLKVFPRDKTFQNYLGNSKQICTGLPDHWIPSLHSEYFSIAYRNPDNLLECIVVVPSMPGGLPHIVHHTSEGYVDPDWFNKTVPILYEISCKERPDQEIGKSFKNQKLTSGQVNTINHFFKSDPILEINEICTKCYAVSLPDSGFGVRYLYRGEITKVPPQGIIKEIRFSARKPDSEYEHCRRPYVTELVIAASNMKVETKNGLELTKEGDDIWTMIDSSSGSHKFNDSVKREEVHIDARLYDFDKLTMRLPVCHCTT